MLDIRDEILRAYEGTRDDPICNQLHTIRCILETPIYNSLRAQYLTQLRDWWGTYELPTVDQTKRAIFMFETRNHPNLEFVLLSAAYFARGWSMILVCTNENLALLQTVLGHNARQVHFIVLAQPKNANYESSRQFYNYYMKSSECWNSIPVNIQHVLTVEMDSYMRRSLPEDYVCSKDYCASMWSWSDEKPGGGGITVRSVDFMRRICEELPTLCETVWAQDYWASDGVEKLGGTFCNKVFTESALHDDPVGVHQWWTFFTDIEERLPYFETYLRLEL